MNQNTNRPYQNTNRPYQNTNGPYQNTNKHYQNTNNAFSKYQRRKFIIPTLKFIISKYQQPYQNTNRPYDHVQNTNTSNSPFQNTNSPTKIPTDPMIMFKIPTDPMIMFKIPTDPMKGGGGGVKTLSKWNVGVFQWIGLCIKVIFMHNSCWFNHFKKDVLWDTLVMPCHRKINHCNNYYRPKANVKSYSIWSNYLGKAQHSMAMEQNLG